MAPVQSATIIYRSLKHGHNRRSPIIDSHDMNCGLCHTRITYFQEQLTCGHLYHGDCLFRWLKKHVTRPMVKNVCPTCGLLPPGGWSSAKSRGGDEVDGRRRTN